MNINLDELIPGSKYFRWKEFLWLKQWGIYVFPTPQQYVNLIRTAGKMDIIRKHFGNPIIVSSGLRPRLYNKLKKVGGAPHSVHKLGLACDFFIEKYDPPWSCDQVRERLKKHLEKWKIRMENRPGTNWIHIDLREPVNKRYFKP